METLHICKLVSKTRFAQIGTTLHPTHAFMAPFWCGREVNILKTTKMFTENGIHLCTFIL